MAETLFCGRPCGCCRMSSTFHPGSVFGARAKACAWKSNATRKSTAANRSKFREDDSGMALTASSVRPESMRVGCLLYSRKSGRFAGVAHKYTAKPERRRPPIVKEVMIQFDEAPASRRLSCGPSCPHLL